MSKFNGFIFSKLHSIGTRSEGPNYFLQQFDYNEIPIKKQAEPWGEDPNLQKVLGAKATITGEIASLGELEYSKITDFVP